MALRTYIPGLLFVLRAACKYTARYDQQIRQNLPEGAIPAYNAWQTACTAFMAVFPLIPLGD